MDRTRTYWLCQVAGWALFFGIQMSLSPDNWASGEVRTTLLTWALRGSLGIGLTHAIRAFVKRRGWTSLSLKRLIPRAAITAVVGGSSFIGVENVLIALSPMRRVAHHRADPPPADGAIGATLIVGIWLAIYFGIHAAWNYRQAEIDRWKLQARAEAARLDALKLQLNPHFFFNSLASVRSLISEAPRRAKKMVARLARLLRKTLQASDEETVTLRDELATTKTYLQLEKVRFEDRLDWTINASEEALGLSVPHMLVQTLVENAVKHGVAQRQGGGVIRVRAAVAGETGGDGRASGEKNPSGEKSGEEPPLIRLEVTNPGTLGEGSGAEQGSGTGLTNARERLRLLFGEEASLTLKQSGSETVTATVQIPTASERPFGKASSAVPQANGATEEGASAGRPFASDVHGSGAQRSSPRPAGNPETAEEETGSSPTNTTDSPAPRSDDSVDWSESRSYWICQLVGWSGLLGAVSGVEALVDESTGGVEALLTIALMAGVFGGLGIAITHAFRAYAKRKRWPDLPPRQLLPRTTVAAVLMGSIYVTVPAPFILHATELPTTWGPWLWAILSRLAPPAFGFSILMALWIAIYFGVHTVRSRRRAEIDRWKLQARAETARLKALKLQLNPHFFFNSLASVRSLISEAPARARKMVGRLARLLRRTLQASDEKTVPLRDELSTTRTYLELEKVRFEDRLDWTIDVQEAALQRQVPYMLVQTLVENAVKHGIGQRRAGGTIRVEASVEGEEAPLRLQVTNPGELGETAGAEHGRGTGLENARERLRLLFGDEAALTLAQSGPETVTATAQIPRPSALEDRLAEDEAKRRASTPTPCDAVPTGTGSV